ncbi:MAG: LptF/LptG family permease [Desulfocapsa sp.]|nr:LptF/LptG family permease [Desulfocapsa sp.]
MPRALRISTLLCSYLATEMLAPFFASFLIMNSVFFLVKLIPFLNVVLNLEIGFADFVRLFLYLFPNMFLYSIPMSAMMGVIICFTRLSADAEILAFKANGISLYQMIPPVLIVSTFIALLTGYFSVNLIPRSEIAMKQLMFQVAKEKIDKGIKEHQFTEALGDLVVYVETIDKVTGRWGKVWVSDMRGQVFPIITMARSGTMNAQVDTMQVTITLEDGSLHRPDGNRSQIIAFDKYTINIPLQPPTILDGEDVTRISTASMTMDQLQESATTVGRDTPQGRDRLVHFHKRLTLPVGCFILSLLGMPLGLQAGPGRKAIGVPLGLAFFILYYILFTVGKSLAEQPGFSLIFWMWLPNIFLLGVTIFFLRQAANERSIIPDLVKNILSQFMQKMVSPALQNLKAIFKKTVDKKEREGQTGVLRKRVKSASVPLMDQYHLTEGTVHGDIKNHVFHITGCESYSCRTCTIEFINVQLAMESGMKPCPYCQNLLDELKAKENLP